MAISKATKKAASKAVKNAVAEAKKDETRDRRVAKVIEALRGA